MTDFESFAAGLSAGRAQLVTTRLVADLETPVSAYLKLATGADGGACENSFLLESVQGGEARGRYSIIGLKPDLVWRANGNVAQINREALTGGLRLNVVRGAGRSPAAPSGFPDALIFGRPFLSSARTIWVWRCDSASSSAPLAGSRKAEP